MGNSIEREITLLADSSKLEQIESYLEGIGYTFQEIFQLFVDSLFEKIASQEKEEIESRLKELGYL